MIASSGKEMTTGRMRTANSSKHMTTGRMRTASSGKEMTTGRMRTANSGKEMITGHTRDANSSKEMITGHTRDARTARPARQEERRIAGLAASLKEYAQMSQNQNATNLDKLVFIEVTELVRVTNNHPHMLPLGLPRFLRFLAP